MVAKYVCICPKCLKHWVIVDGQRIPGRKINFPTPSTDNIQLFLNKDQDEVYDLGKAGDSQTKIWKKSRISCKAELWQTQRFGKEYNKSIEDYLAKAFQRPATADHEEMSDLQDNPHWKNLKNQGKDKYNLVFGLYIDWFNPQGNRIESKCRVAQLFSTV
ncbi:hypothetical protein DFH09DRAFT_1109715 [Mycena vulgaris]|nr:hypothetical protein DFH09DRAFT_1109715 [Mycena vulgaris]